MKTGDRNPHENLQGELDRLRAELTRRERDSKIHNDRQQRKIDGLQRQIERLKRENDHLKQQLATERRAGRRQAAPFAKDRPQGRGGRPGTVPRSSGSAATTPAPGFAPARTATAFPPADTPEASGGSTGTASADPPACGLRHSDFAFHSPLAASYPFTRSSSLTPRTSPSILSAGRSFLLSVIMRARRLVRAPAPRRATPQQQRPEVIAMSLSSMVSVTDSTAVWPNRPFSVRLSSSSTSSSSVAVNVRGPAGLAVQDGDDPPSAAHRI